MANTVVLILISVTLSAVAQVLFKSGVSTLQIRGPVWDAQALIALAGSWHVLSGLALYMFGMIFWLHALSQTELSRAYPFVGLGFVLTAVLGTLLFNDAMSLTRLAGTVMVIAGISLVAAS